MSQQDARPMMSLPEAIAQCLRKYADFSGRATRAEFWWWVLGTVGGGAVIGAVARLILSDAGAILSSLFWLATLLPTLAVCTRRLHDTNRSAWWLLLMALSIPGYAGFYIAGITIALSGVFGGQVSGGIVVLFLISVVLIVCPIPLLLIFLTRRGTVGSNRYGPAP